MAVSMFTRFVNIRNILNVNNIGVTGCTLNAIQNSYVTSKSYCTGIDQANNDLFPGNMDKTSHKKISKAMKAYLQRSRDYKEFIQNEIAEYDIGKRHLANIMGEDAEEMTEDDINNAIRYLFPSGLYDRQARPIMMHPTKLYENRKEAEFDETGRPYHFLFYTTKPNYYEVLHKMSNTMAFLNKMEDKKLLINHLPTPEDKLDLTGSTWLQMNEMEKKLLEYISDKDYEYLIKSLESLANHPLSKHATSIIMEYRRVLTSITENIEIPAPDYDIDNRPFIHIKDCARKNSRGQVKVIGDGSGKITINGTDITYFQDMQCREQIIFPLIFTDMSEKVDIEATVSGGGPTGQAGAIRWGIAYGLRSFVDHKMIERMRVAGLLTRDWRRRERKKWGQRGAREKFTWKKR